MTSKNEYIEEVLCVSLCYDLTEEDLDRLDLTISSIAAKLGWYRYGIL